MARQYISDLRAFEQQARSWTGALRVLPLLLMGHILPYALTVLHHLWGRSDWCLQDVAHLTDAACIYLQKCTRRRRRRRAQTTRWCG